ncbi:hypothetical protein U9M48_014703, partial [Paspalum notatum var. saurae]
MVNLVNSKDFESYPCTMLLAETETPKSRTAIHHSAPLRHRTRRSWRRQIQTDRARLFMPSMVSKRTTTRRRVEKEKCIMNCLPRELIEQVFLKLAASCLLQCISVCKMWRSIIRDSQFVMAHLQHVPSCTLLFSPQRWYPSDAIIFDETWSPSTWAVPVIGPDDLLCGTCNGLLCLHTPTSTIKIANLATGECLYLKKPTKSLKDDHFSFYRFGFHPVTKEYKVIHFCQKSSRCTEGRFNVIQVYTLGDKKWTDVVTPVALSLNCVKNSGVVIVDGTMYWLTEDTESNWQHAAISFDLGEGSFAQIQLPAVDLEDLAFGDVRHYWITVINGKVCVCTAQRLSGMLISKLQVWALNGSVDERWSHMYNIQLSSLFARGLHFVSGDKILIQDSDCNLYSYQLLGKNFEIESSKMVKLLDLGHRGEADLQFYICVKSLVPLDLYAKAAGVHRPKRQGGWKLKKWKAWEDLRIEQEKLGRVLHQTELDILEFTRHMDIVAKEISQRFPDEMIQQCPSMEIYRILLHLPNCPVQVMSVQHPSPVRRLNWVGRVEDMKKLKAHLVVLKDRCMVLKQANEDLYRTLKSSRDASRQASDTDRIVLSEPNCDPPLRSVTGLRRRRRDKENHGDGGFSVIAHGSVLAALQKGFVVLASLFMASMVSKRTTRRRVEKEKCIMNCLPRELIEQHVPSCTLMFSPQGSDSGMLYPSDAIIFDEAWSPSTLAVPVIEPDDLLCGTCNGLLCLHTPRSTIKIANLATGECLYLKKPTKSLKDDHFSFYRFGFHPVTKEYKVIHFFQESSPCTEGRFNVIQVYTLGVEKWKDVVTPEALSLNCVKNSGVVIVDGTMYWLTEDTGSNWRHAVMSFDLGEGSFAHIQLPAVDLEDLAFSDARHYWITVINGKVCVSTAQCLSGMLIGNLQVWTLNGSVDERWSHMCNIQLSSLFARGLHFVSGDKILIQHLDCNLYSYQLLGKNFEIESSKMVKLLDLSPRGEADLQFYICLKSLVPLDLYAKAAGVRRTKRQGVWKLKKWKAWEDVRFRQEKLWRMIHQKEVDILERTRHLVIGVKEVLQGLQDEVIWQNANREIDRILLHLPNCPEQHPSSVRRLNWVEMMEDLKKLEKHFDLLSDRLKVLAQARQDLVSTLRSYVDAYCQASGQAHVQARKKQSTAFFPEDIIEQILLRLPASTLTKYRAVCKQWNRIIRDPQFITAHLRRAPRRPLLFFNQASVSKKRYPSDAILFDEAWSPSRFDVPIIEPDEFLCASCNGFVCLYSDRSTIKIANLATGESLHFAKPVKRLNRNQSSFYSFGFHPVTKEYKVIHIVYGGNDFNTIQVYTLGEDKRRDIRVPEVGRLYSTEMPGAVIVDGVMYWLTAAKKSKWGHALVSFDLSEERFEWIQLPANVDLGNSMPGCVRLFHITEVGGKVKNVTITGRLTIGEIKAGARVNIPRPYFIHGSKFVVYDYGRNMYYNELMGQDVKIEWGKIVNLLNYGPRWFRSMQSYMRVESLVRLDACLKASIVRTLKRQEGWESKKWMRWTQDLSVLQKLWRNAYALERFGRSLGMDINPQLEHPPPPVKNRLNWVEQKRVRGMLKTSMLRLAGMLIDMELTLIVQSNKMIHEAVQ